MDPGVTGVLISGIDDRPRSIALVEFQSRDVVLPDLRIGAERRVVGQALEIELRAKCPGLFPHPLIERRADPAPHAAFGRGNDLQIREANVRNVEQERHAEGLVAAVLRHEQARDKAVLQRIRQLVGKLGDVLVRHTGELLAHDLLRRLDGCAVGGGGGVGDFADAQHLRRAQV